MSDQSDAAQKAAFAQTVAYNEGLKAKEYNGDVRDNQYDPKKEPNLHKAWLDGFLGYDR